MLPSASIEAVDSHDVHAAHLGGLPDDRIGVGIGDDGGLPVAGKCIPERQEVVIMKYYHYSWSLLCDQDKS